MMKIASDIVVDDAQHVTTDTSWTIGECANLCKSNVKLITQKMAFVIVVIPDSSCEMVTVCHLIRFVFSLIISPENAQDVWEDSN